MKTANGPACLLYWYFFPVIVSPARPGETLIATRSHTTFKKRQKELARQEKQREKAAKRMQRKLDKRAGIVRDTDDMIDRGETSESGDPGPAASDA